LAAWRSLRIRRRLICKSGFLEVVAGAGTVACVASWERLIAGQTALRLKPLHFVLELRVPWGFRVEIKTR
jgi:hypothetical protein